MGSIFEEFNLSDLRHSKFHFVQSVCDKMKNLNFIFGYPCKSKILIYLIMSSKLSFELIQFHYTPMRALRISKHAVITLMYVSN